MSSQAIKSVVAIVVVVVGIIYPCYRLEAW